MWIEVIGALNSQKCLLGLNGCNSYSCNKISLDFVGKACNICIMYVIYLTVVIHVGHQSTDETNMPVST